MSGYVLQTRGLTKKYKLTTALDNVSINLKEGRIYGFIGQNGAGKTTFFRLVAGLTFPTSGDINLFGTNKNSELVKARKKIGCIIETPSLYPDMTAYENLEIKRIGGGIPDKGLVKKALELVGLLDTGKKQVKDFSLGMKQRLAIAAAVLNDPEFLLLDEPINGLDPVSIVEIRGLLKRLCEENRITILLSSHILSELYQLATDYIFIHKGKIIDEATQKQLDEKCRRHISIKVDNTPLAVTVLEKKLGNVNLHVMPDKSIKLYDHLDEIEKVSKTLFENGLIISGINLQGEDLENYFINLIGGVSHA